MKPLGKLRLGVNIDHVATVRNARGSVWPDPLRAAGCRVSMFIGHDARQIEASARILSLIHI